MTLIEMLTQDILGHQGTKVDLPYVVVIDGRCGSGKSTLAKELSQSLKATVIHMDDYYLPGELRNPERMTELGGTIHYERFINEVLEPIEQGEPIHYQPFNCRTQQLELPSILLLTKILIIEGAYSLLPQFSSMNAYKIFMTHTPDVQQLRLENRVGKKRLEDFNRYWIPREEKYFDELNIKDQCHKIIDTTTMW
jgi:uridine kinase